MPTADCAPPPGLAPNRGYLPVALDLSAQALRTLSMLADRCGTDTAPDGSTVIAVADPRRDLSMAVAELVDCSDRTADTHLAELAREGVSFVRSESGSVYIELPPIEGKRRPQLPKGSGLSGRALSAWLTLQQLPRTAPLALVADRMGVTANTARSALSELESNGWVVVERSPGRAPNRVLSGLIRRTSETPPNSCVQPLQSVAPLHLSKQRSYKGPAVSGQRSRVPERISGHTPRTSRFDRLELLADHERALFEEDSSEPSPASNKRGLANARAQLGRGSGTRE